MAAAMAQAGWQASGRGQRTVAHSLQVVMCVTGNTIHASSSRCCCFSFDTYLGRRATGTACCAESCKARHSSSSTWKQGCSSRSSSNSGEKVSLKQEHKRSEVTCWGRHRVRAQLVGTLWTEPPLSDKSIARGNDDSPALAATATRWGCKGWQAIWYTLGIFFCPLGSRDSRLISCSTLALLGYLHNSLPGWHDINVDSLPGACLKLDGDSKFIDSESFAALDMCRTRA